MSLVKLRSTAMSLRSVAAALLAVGFVVDCRDTRQSVAQLAPADRVVVHKAERKLLLIYQGNVERSYHLQLGLNPIGQKEREGDSRTPEGTYRLTHNPRSDYYLSLKVSYPNEADLERARAHRWDPGGLIMIHGQPSVLKHAPEYYRTHDWTDGCIALSNADMAEIWRLTRDGMPIDILP
jgi:murein L,D-transpeptidase YafK